MRPLWRSLLLLVEGPATTLAKVPMSRSLPIRKRTLRPRKRAIQRLRFTLAVSALLLCFGSLFDDAARGQEPARRVLMLYPYNNLFPVSVITGEAARKRLIDHSREPLELYTDFLDLGRFSGETHETRTARYLADKYRDRKPDVVIALGPQSLRFVVKNWPDLAVPIVFCCTSRTRLTALNPPGNVTGIISEFDLTKTLSLAQRLQPDASRIVVVAGATEFDQQSVEIARRQLAPYAQKYETTYLAGLSYEKLIEELKRLPRDTIVILLTMFADSAGRLFISPEIVPAMANAATAPLYSPYETYVGRGAVGGHVDLFEQIGREVADLALEILAGGTNPSIPAPRTTGGSVDKVDWRALKRWNLSESRLPPGSEVQFREYTVWERYRWHLMAVFAIVLLQAGLITWLLLERYRRHHAELELRRRLLEVIHLNRTAAAGVLSASFAHELNQPLGAILSNAETAEALLSADPPDLDQLKEILADIRRDDQRAGDIINHLRGLLRKTKDAELQEFDLNEAVRDAARLLSPEATTRGVVLGVSQAEAALPVRADEVHLQQVILNLAMNAMDAMLNCVPGSRRMRLETMLVGDAEVEVSVSDSGSGIPNDKLNDVFETFFTTKPQGTGLGLSIARTIVETYGGRIWAENRTGGGAVFRFTLPLAKTQTA